jgi:hypothetical protein
MKNIILIIIFLGGIALLSFDSPVRAKAPTLASVILRPERRS